MTEPGLSEASLTSMLDAWLRQHPRAVLGAFAEDGTVAPLPDAPELSGYTAIPAPARRATLLDLVVPGDRINVLTTWERAVQKGVARTTVRMLDDPDRPLSLAFIDARHRHGVRLGILVAEEQAGDDGNGEVALGSLDVYRPRTATLEKSLYAVITAVDDRAAAMLGISAEEMLGERSLAFLHPDDHDRIIANWLEFIKDRRTARIRVRHRTGTGAWLWTEVEHTFHEADDPDDIRVTAQLTDISDEMAAHDALDRREKLFRRLAESLPSGLFQVHTDRTVVYANARLARMLGVQAATLEEQLAMVSPADRPALDEAFDAVLDHGTDQQLEVSVLLPDPGTRAPAEERRCAVTLVALSDREGAPGAIVTVTDVTEAARMREELKHRATFDALTGCHNRASTVAALEQALATADRPLSVIFIDLNHFKPINDELGHAAGDDLLVHTAQSLRGLLRDSDVAGRIGGDEFLLLCREAHTADAAMAVADRVRAALTGEVAVRGGKATLGASIGVAVSEPGLTADDLIAHADMALYGSKRLRDGTPVLHCPELGSMP